MSSESAESCIRKAVDRARPHPGLVGLADAKAEDEAASRWADCASAYGDGMARPRDSGCAERGFGRDGRGLRGPIDVAMR